MKTTPLSVLVFSLSAGFLAGCASNRVIILDHPVDTPLTQVVNEYTAHGTTPRVTAVTGMLNGVVLPFTGPGPGNTWTAPVTENFLTTTQLLKITATLSSYQSSDWLTDQHTFHAAWFEMFENPVTGPSRTVPAGSSPSHGSASPGPAHFVVSISATHPKQLVISIASGLNHMVTPTITFTGPGVVSLGSLVVFSPSANRLVIPVTGVTAGAFTIQLAAAGFQTSSFTGTVVP